MNAIEFKRISRKGNWLNIEVEKVLTEHHQPVQHLFIIASGQAEVLVDQTPVATLGKGAMIGDMSYLEEKVASATVRAMTAMRVFSLAKADLKELIDKHEEMRPSLYMAIGISLANKLRFQKK